MYSFSNKCVLLADQALRNELSLILKVAFLSKKKKGK